MRWYTYILLCDQKKYYVGITDNIERRLLQHQKKESFYTKQFDKVELIHKEVYASRFDAEARETQLKKWSIAKKKALVSGDTESLVKLSKGPGLTKDHEGLVG